MNKKDNVVRFIYNVTSTLLILDYFIYRMYPYKELKNNGITFKPGQP